MPDIFDGRDRKSNTGVPSNDKGTFSKLMNKIRRSKDKKNDLKHDSTLGTLNSGVTRDLNFNTSRHIVGKYIPTRELVRDRSLFNKPDIMFHGIGFNFSIMKSILEHGIISIKEGERKNISISTNNASTASYNGEHSVSLVANPGSYHTHDRIAFGTYVRNGISFVIDTRGLKPYNANSDSPDEMLIDGKIPVSNILGIMIPSNMFETNITNLSFVKHCADGKIIPNALGILNHLAANYNHKLDMQKFNNLFSQLEELLSNRGNKGFFERWSETEKIKTEIELAVREECEKTYKVVFNKGENETVTLGEVINLYTPKSSNIKIYDSGVLN